MKKYFPSTLERTPWPTALLSLLPFLLGGPVRIILSYQPNWDPRQSSMLYFGLLLLSSLAAAGGLVLGAVNKFPRWAYPYAIYLAFSLYLVVMYTIYLFGWDIRDGSSFFGALAVILIVLGLPGFRSFYRRIPGDWTLLSYGLYGLVLYLLGTIDFDEAPRLTLLVVLPSALSLVTALAHLRIQSGFLRIAALLAGTFTGLFFWLLPIFQGMISIWIGVGMGLFVLLVYGMVLAAILLAPMVVARLIHSRRTAQAAG